MGYGRVRRVVILVLPSESLAGVIENLKFKILIFL